MNGLSPRHLISVLLLICSLSHTAFAAVPIPEGARSGVVDPTEEHEPQTFIEHSSDPFEVPPVYRRPLDIDEGPRIHVRKFVVTGVVDHPELGITQATVDSLVERLRRQMQTLDVLNEEGFTDDEMKAIAELMRRALVDKDVKSAQEYEAFIARLREQKRYREEMSIGQLQEVATELTNFYRHSGLVVAQAYVPAQTVTNGVVTLHVMEGVLGKVIVEGNHDYSTERLTLPFSSLEKQAVSKSQLESALLRVTDYPGLTAYGVLQPGSEVGETDLLIKTLLERKHGFTVRADNHGSASTGEYRLRLSYDLYNPLGRADEFNLNLIGSFKPANTLYGGVKYQTPIINEKWSSGFGASQNQFEVGGDYSEFEITGTVTTVNLFVRNDLIRSRSANFYGQFDFARKSAETRLKDQTIGQDIVFVATLEVGGDFLDSRFSGINQGTLQYGHGIPGLLGALEANDPTASRRGGSGEVAGGEFDKVVIYLSRLQSLGKSQNMLLRLSGQYSPDLLPPIEQYSLGGPNNVRAYAVSEYLRDRAWFSSLDLNFNAPGFQDVRAFRGRSWGEIFQLSLFADYAKGYLNDPLSNEESSITLAGYGAGAQLLIPGEILARLEVAMPTTSAEPANHRSPQYYFQLQYSF